MASGITVAALTISYWDLVSELFATSSGVNRCWCMWPRRPRGSHVPDKEANRQAMEESLKSGKSPGFIALLEERAVGWCAVGPRKEYPQYGRTTGQRVFWAIPCLYVDPAVERIGVARALIDAAVGLASENDAVAVEGPPAYWLPGDAAAIATATSAFLENGFERIGPGARMPDLRRVLRSGH